GPLSRLPGGDPRGEEEQEQEGQERRDDQAHEHGSPVPDAGISSQDRDQQAEPEVTEKEQDFHRDGPQVRTWPDPSPSRTASWSPPRAAHDGGGPGSSCGSPSRRSPPGSRRPRDAR